MGSICFNVDHSETPPREEEHQGSYLNGNPTHTVEVPSVPISFPLILSISFICVVLVVLPSHYMPIYRLLLILSRVQSPSPSPTPSLRVFHPPLPPTPRLVLASRRSLEWNFKRDTLCEVETCVVPVTFCSRGSYPTPFLATDPSPPPPPSDACPSRYIFYPLPRGAQRFPPLKRGKLVAPFVQGHMSLTSVVLTPAGLGKLRQVVHRGQHRLLAGEHQRLWSCVGDLQQERRPG